MANKKEIIVPIILFILGFAPFLLNLNGFFVSDDWDFLTQLANPHQPLWRYFFTNYMGAHNGGSYRPLAVFFWAAAHHFWQLNYFWYHFLQVLMHAGNAALLYFIVLNFWHPAKKEDRFVFAALASFIFIILPNHSEAVAWLAAVVDPLSAFFYLASLLALLLCLRFIKLRYWLYASSLLLFFAAILTKEMAMSLPFVVLIFTAFYLWQKRDKAIKLLITVPYFILLAGFFWLRYRAIGLFFGYYGQDHLHLSLAKAAAVYGDIIASFVLSDKLRTIFSFWLNNNLLIVLAAFILFLAALVYFTLKKKLPLWPWLIFLSLIISLVPVMNFGINLTQTYFSEESERYGYLPSIFFSILLAAAIVARKKNIGRRAPCFYIFPIVIIFLAAGLFGQLLIKNQRQAEAASLAQSSLFSAVAQMRAGDYQGALFFGLPSNFHGANIFRNGWQEAIAFYLPNPPIILSPFSRTAIELGEKFTVEKIADNVYNYTSADKTKLILAKPEFSSADYSMTLGNYVYEPTGSTDRYFGDNLKITLSPNLATQKNIALFFWNGSDWSVLK